MIAETLHQTRVEITERLKVHLKDSAEMAANVLEQYVKKHVSLTDHSLKALADMGHPYAASHSNPPHGNPDVHSQSGRLKAAIRKKVYVSDTHCEIKVGVDSGAVPYVGYIIEGTSKMIPRDFIGFADKECHDKVEAIITNGLGGGTSRGGKVK